MIIIRVIIFCLLLLMGSYSIVCANPITRSVTGVLYLFSPNADPSGFPPDIRVDIDGHALLSENINHGDPDFFDMIYFVNLKVSGLYSSEDVFDRSVIPSWSFNYFYAGTGWVDFDSADVYESLGGGLFSSENGAGDHTIPGQSIFVMPQSFGGDLWELPIDWINAINQTYCLDITDRPGRYSSIRFTPVPEPTTMLLLGTGLLGLAGFRKMFRK